MRIGWIFCGLLLAGMLAFAPAQSRAENDAAEKAKAGEHGDAGGAPKEEAPNLFKRQLDLGLWTIVVFVVLLIVLRKYAWKPLIEGLDKREHNIQSAMEEAKNAKEEAHRLRDELQKEAAKAQEQVREVLDKARRDAEHATSEILAKAKADIQIERERMRREIETARDQAVQELWAQAAQLATLISSKAIRRQLSLDDHRRLVDEAITDLGSAGKQRQRLTASV